MLRRRTAGPRVVQRRDAVVFRIGNRRVAVPAARVLEVSRVLCYTPLPCEDPANLGVVLHRGRLVPLVELGRRLGVPRSGIGESPGLCVFVRARAGEIAFPVDEIIGFQSSAGEALPADVSVADLDRMEGPNAQSAAG